VLYYLAENLEARAEEFSDRIATLTGAAEDAAAEEVAQSVRRISFYAAHADKYDGHVHSTRSRHVTLAMNEPWGVMGICCPDEAPLLALVSLVAPAIAMGNRVVVTPSPSHPLVATDFYQVLDTSDVPGGVINLVTGERESLARTLAEHDDVAALWFFGTAAGSTAIESASPATSRPPGPMPAGPSNGRIRPRGRVASSCAAPPRSRISGCPTANKG
jgi:aldehyde dehydrogenase (NAD+)